MEFTAREDIEAPIDYVFEQVTDFPTFERSIMRRGGEVERLHGGDGPELGTKWQVKFAMRGKERKINAEIVRVEPPHGMAIGVRSPNVDGTMEIELVALSRARTRLIVSAQAVAKTLPAKLVVQSMRFGRAKTEKRFKELVTGFAEDVETRHRG